MTVRNACLWLCVLVLVLPATASAVAQQQDANIHVTWNQGEWRDVINVDQDVAIPTPATRSFWAAAWLWRGQAEGGYVGLQHDAPSLFSVPAGDVGIFSVWGATASDGPHCGAFGGEGTGMSCRATMKIVAGRFYKYRVARLQRTDPAGEWWGAWIIDTVTGASTYLGSLRSAAGAEYISQFSNFSEYFGPAVPTPADVPRSVALFTQPAANRGKPGAYQYYSAFDSWRGGAGATRNVRSVSVPDRGTNAAEVTMGDGASSQPAPEPTASIQPVETPTASPPVDATPAPVRRRCGYVDTDSAVSAEGVSCRVARSVTRAFNKGRRRHGFRCRKRRVNAGGGYVAVCRRAAARVRIYPE